jgi:hypothetical protein
VDVTALPGPDLHLVTRDRAKPDRVGTRLDAGDALRTHELCERIVTSL